MKKGDRVITIKGFSSGEGSKYFPEGTKGTISRDNIFEINEFIVIFDNYKNGKTLELINKKAEMWVNGDSIKKEI